MDAEASVRLLPLGLHCLSPSPARIDKLGLLSPLVRLRFCAGISARQTGRAYALHRRRVSFLTDFRKEQPHRSLLAAGQHFLLRGRAPQLYEAVITPRGQYPAVRRNSHRHNLSTVSL